MSYLHKAQNVKACHINWTASSEFGTYAQLEFVMTECLKTQIRLTGLN